MAMTLAITATSSLSSRVGLLLLDSAVLVLLLVPCRHRCWSLAPAVVENFVHPGNDELQDDECCKGNAHAEYGGDQACHKLVRK